MLPEDRLDALLACELAGMRRLDTLPGDDALEPLLAAAGTLQPLRDAHPSAVFTDVLEAHLLARVSAGAATIPRDVTFANHDGVTDTAIVPAAPSATRSPRAIRSAPSARRPRFLWPAVAAAMLLVAVGTLTAAAAAGPGSPLYGLHRFEQSVRVALSGNPADRMRLHLGYASDALNAANAAARAGDNVAFADGLTTLRSELDAAASELPSIPPGADHDSLAAQLTALRSRAIAGLRSDLPTLNWPNRLGSTDALAAFGDTVPRVTGATAQRMLDPSAPAHTWRVVVTGVGFAPGAQLLVNGQPTGTVVSVSNTTLVAEYTAAAGQPPDALGVDNPDNTAAQTVHVAIIPPGQGAMPGPTSTPGDHGSGSGKGGHGGGHGTPTPTPPTGG